MKHLFFSTRGPLAALVFFECLGSPVLAAQQVTCAAVKVEQNQNCAALKVQFDIAACDDKVPVGPVGIQCKQDFLAEVVVDTAAFSYFASLTRSGDGNWVPGAVFKESRRAAPVVEAKLAPPMPLKPEPVGDPKTFTVSGSFRLRSDIQEKTDYASRRSFAPLRLRVDLSWAPAADMQVFFQPQASENFGEAQFVGSSASTNTSQETSGQSYDTALTFHQAFWDYHPSSNLKLTLGRQVLAYGNDLLIGASDWNNIGRSFDAARARLSYELTSKAKGWSDFFVSKLNDTNIKGSGLGDKTLYGLYNGLSLGDYLQNLDLYVFHLGDSTSGSASGLWTTGFRAQSKFNSFDYRFEYTKQSKLTSGYQANLELGFSFLNSNILRVAPEYFIASSNYNQLYPSTRKWLGFADILGRRNIRGGAIHVSVIPATNFTLLFDAYYFQRVDLNQSAFKKNGKALGTGNASSSNSLGLEYNLTAKYQLNKITVITTGIAFFNSGDYLTTQFGQIDPSSYYAQVETKF